MDVLSGVMNAVRKLLSRRNAIVSQPLVFANLIHPDRLDPEYEHRQSLLLILP